MFSPRWHLLLAVTLLGGSLSFASGCATGSQTRHGIPAGQWQARLPSTKSPIASLAFGRGGNSAAAPLSEADVAALSVATPDDVLQPMVAAKTVAVSKPKARQVLPKAAPAVAEPQVAESALAPQIALAEPAPLLASNDTPVQQRYAEREQAAQEQQKFRGGDAIVISAGALVVVLLIVILVLLLR